MAELRAHLGAKIAHYRGRAKLTQEALGAAIGVSQNTIYRIENGKSWPEYDNLAAIAAALKVTPEAFFEDLTSPAVAPTPQQALAVLTDAVARLAALDDKQARRHDDINPDALAPLPEDDNDLLGDPEESNHKAPKPRRS